MRPTHLRVFDTTLCRRLFLALTVPCIGLLGAVATLAATVAGNWIPGSPLEPYFSLSKEQTILALTGYGFVASVLPVWMLLCPRDYLSSYLKIGTIALLVLVVVWSLMGMTVAQTPWLANSGLLQAIFYVVAGIGWVLPAMPIISWMARPDS